MKWLFDLSFRYKIPLWGSFLIVTSAAFVSGSLMARAYNDLRADLFISADSLGRSLAKTLFPAMLHDNVWQAYEFVRAPVQKASAENPVQAEMVLALDRNQQVYVSSIPKVLPMLADIRYVSAEFAEVARRIEDYASRETLAVDLPGFEHLYFVIPIADEQAQLGSLVLVYSRAAFLDRFRQISIGAGMIAATVLAILLPINWYWGQRTAKPLVMLAERMGQIGRRVPEDLDPGLYAYGDELGRLFEAYGRMVKELREKSVLETEMVRSERLAAIGRLSAGIAHEINNPLAGMLTAISTFKAHGTSDARTLKTVSLIERGLLQVQDTVAALLVEAKLGSRALAAQDIEDVRTLLEPEARRKSLRFGWHGELDRSVDLPATLVRQILINLLLNAIHAAGSRVDFRVALQDDALELSVANDGEPLPQAVKERLFEPFTTTGSGHGLGLWVTYQIVQQLGGHIAAYPAQEGAMTRFDVKLPVQAPK